MSRSFVGCSKPKKLVPTESSMHEREMIHHYNIIANYADHVTISNPFPRRSNIYAAIEKVPRLPPQDDHVDSHSEATPVRLQRKRTLSSISEEQSTSKRQRLLSPFNPSQSPGVQV